MTSKLFSKPLFKVGKIAGIGLMVILLFATYQSHAQCWQWAINTGGTSLENPTSMAVGPQGQIAITGEFLGAAVIGPNTLVGGTGRDVFTAMLDSNGVVLKGMGGIGDGPNNIGNGVAIDGFGNVFVTGNFTGTIAFDTVSLVSAGQGDIFIVKYDPSGTLLWAKRAGGGDNIYAHDIAVDPSGNCYLTGGFYGTAGFDSHQIISSVAEDVFTAKYDPDGNALWAASCGSSSSDIGSGIALDTLGNAYITGYFQGNFVFNAVPYASNGSRDVFIAKYTAAGVPQWFTGIGGNRNDFLNKIAVNGDGSKIYATGEFESSVINVDGITLNNEDDTPPRRDIMLIAFNQTGQAQWGIRAGSKGHDYANDIAVDDSGHVYITGIFNDTLMFDTTMLFNEPGDLYVAKFAPSGTFLWATQSTTNNALAEGKSIAVYHNEPLVSGSFVLGAVLNSVVFGTDTLTSNGSTDVFVASLGSPCDTSTTAIEGGNENTHVFRVYPNPFHDRLHVQIDASFRRPLDIRLYNLQGKLIFSEIFKAGEPISFDFAGYPVGTYFLRVSSDVSDQSFKVIKKTF